MLNPKIKIVRSDQIRELEEYLLEEEKPLQPDLFYQGIYNSRDEFIRQSIKNNY